MATKQKRNIVDRRDTNPVTVKIGNQTVHVQRSDLSAVFPVMDSEHFAQVTQSVLTHGYQDPEISYSEMVSEQNEQSVTIRLIHDGWHRFVIAANNGKLAALKWREVDPESQMGRLVGANFHRRHLSVAERASVALKLRDTFGQNGKRMTHKQCAETFGISLSSIEKLDRCLKANRGRTMSMLSNGEKLVAIARALGVQRSKADERKAEADLAARKAESENGGTSAVPVQAHERGARPGSNESAQDSGLPSVVGSADPAKPKTFEEMTASKRVTELQTRFGALVTDLDSLKHWSTTEYKEVRDGMRALIGVCERKSGLEALNFVNEQCIQALTRVREAESKNGKTVAEPAKRKRASKKKTAAKPSETAAVAS